MMTTQGAEANQSGGFLEQLVEDEFSRRGIPVFNYSDKGNTRDMFAERILLRNVPYTSIYGCQSRSEFLYRDFRLDDIRIEARWQQVPGSVDEKLPYLFMNAVRCMPEREVWFLIEGGGARTEAVDWLKTECAQVAAKRLRVLTIPEIRIRIKEVLRPRENR